MDDLPAQELTGEAPGGDAGRPLPAGESVLADPATGSVLDSVDLAADERIGRSSSHEGDSSTGRRPRWLRTQRWLKLRPGSGPARQRAIWLVLTVGLVLGFSGAVPLPDRSSSGASPSPSAGTSGATPGSHETPGAGVSGFSAPESHTPMPSAVAVASQTSPTAAVSFFNLMLDSPADTSDRIRSFSFVSDGPGLVSAQIVAASPTESTRLCLTVDGARPECASGATPGVSQAAPAVHSSWTVTLASADEGTPTVDLAITWPADHPSIGLAGGCFQGYPNPDSLRSLNASFKARTAGQMTVTASWQPAVTDATLTLTDATNSNVLTLDRAGFQAAGAIPGTYSHKVAAGRLYTVSLFNAGPNAGRPGLSATIAFP